MFVGKQIFACSWGRNFVGKLYDVTKEDEYNMCTSTKRVIFLTFY